MKKKATSQWTKSFWPSTTHQEPERHMYFEYLDELSETENLPAPPLNMSEDSQTLSEVKEPKSVNDALRNQEYGLMP